MQKVFDCHGDKFSNIDLEDANLFLIEVPGSKVVSVTHYFQPIQSPNTISHGQYGVIIVVDTN